MGSKRDLDLTRVDRSMSRPRRNNELANGEMLRGVGSPNPNAGDFTTGS